MKERKRTGQSARHRQLTRAVKEFDEELVADSFSEPPAAAKDRLARARRRPGRPRVGRGAEVISVSVERGLLERSDKLAKLMGITRARLIARGLKAVLAAEGQL